MEGFYNAYDSMIRRVCPGYDDLLELVARNIPAGAKSVLDLGCGTGTLASRVFERLPGVRYFGIDLQESLVEAARKKLEGKKAVFIAGDIMRADWPPADCVVSSLALHHLSHEDKERVFRKIQQSSSCFIYFDRIKGRTPEEDS